jgi:carboxyl-terminal processing protease
VDKIVGEEGSFVTIEFKRGGLFYEIELERRKIAVPTVIPFELDSETYNITEELSRKIASYKITTFADKTDESLNIKIQKAIEDNVEYLIIDMRDNGGGYLETAVNILEELIPKGTIVSLMDKSGEIDIKKSTLEEAPFKVVLIVNNKSASASEIFAGAIKDSNVGVVIGEQTFGKGVAQNIYRIGSEYLVKLTTQEFFSPNGDKINGVGVTPNIIVDTPDYVFSNRRFYSSDVDEQIVNVEAMLKILGYFNEEPDDTYTYETYLAVYSFQSATGLYPYGVCDFTTQARLNTEYRIATLKNDLQMKEAVKWIVKDTQK